MKRTTFLTLVMIFGAVALSPAISSAGKGPTYTPKLCQKPKIKPGKIILTCADAGLFVKHIRYSFYNGKEGGGTGKAFANDCMPSCAGGTYRKYSVKFRLTRPRIGRCGGERVRYFHRIKLTWKGDRPAQANSKTEKFDLYCAP